MRRDPVITMRAAVHRWNGRLGPGLFGLACSGGADSMALADAAIEVCGPASVIVIHIDHGLRDESARIGAEVAAWASSRGVAAVVRRVVVAREGSLEAAARAARYDGFAAVATELGLTSLWIAHTRDDQAETVLMRIVRGTGPAGLAAMAEERGMFVRPLLGLSRRVVRAYHAERHLPEWYDPMNADLRLTRVKFREEVMPALSELNPALDESLARLAASAREWIEVIDALAMPHAHWPLDCAVLRELRPAIRKRAYALTLEHAALGYDATHLEQIDELVMRDAAGEVHLDIAGVRLTRSYDQVSPARPLPPPADTPTPPPGHELRLWRAGDRMKPARLKGRSRKLSDLFIDAKIAREKRAAARVIVRVLDQEIVWAEYIGAAHGESFQDI